MGSRQRRPTFIQFFKAAGQRVLNSVLQGVAQAVDTSMVMSMLLLLEGTTMMDILVPQRLNFYAFYPFQQTL